MVREDVERIVQNVLRDLSIKIEDGGFTDPNSRCVKLMLNGRELSREYFNVVQKDEYEG